MKKLNDLYEQITPATAPEALAQKVIRTADANPASKRRAFRPLTAVAAAAAAMSALVITAGAANEWDYGAIFESIFGDKSQNITESTISQARIIRDDIEGFDLEVAAAAADKHSALVILDVFPEDGADLSEISGESLSDFIADNINFCYDVPAANSSTMGITILEESAEKVRLRINMNSDADISGSDIRLIARRYGKDSGETVFTGSEKSWIAEFTADYTAEEYSYENAMNLETENGQGTITSLDVDNITITPLNAYINGTGTGDYFGAIWNYDDNYAVTDSGEKVYFTDFGSTASAQAGEYGGMSESCCFTFETPVNPEEITAIVLGNQTIELK
ncbi:MAG: hypothetical protein IJ416_07370 [Ruminiclostridium sp.]|nr:hypothetical protein [Ruminiclostridium sp.]